MRKKPLIGITSHFESKDNKYHLSQEYIAAIETAGGTPLILPFYSNASQFLNLIDGLLLSGGGIKPFPKRELNKKTLLSLKKQNPKRYSFEKYLVLKAADLALPILGICRGHQMIGEVFGGRITSQNPLFIPTTIKHNQLKTEKGSKELTHNIYINPDSRLYQILKVRKIKVNSFHFQAVEKSPPDFIVSARAEDGLIEGLESKKEYIFGLQFHPEKLITQNNLFRKIFIDFVNHCQKRKKRFSFL